MAFTLSAVITAARDHHPAFHRTRVPDAVIARFLSDWQNRLIALATARDSAFMRQTASILLALDAANTTGVAGAGTSGGLPGAIDADGDFSAVQAPTGALVELGLTAEDGATVMVAERIVTAATSTTVSSTGAGRTVNEDAGRVVLIVAGTGAGQAREVESNTAAQWTIPSATPWDVVPDTTSLLQIVAPAYRSTERAGVVTALPATTTRTGYLVKVASNGTPYIDFGAPLVADVSVGVPLPSATVIHGGTVWYTSADADPAPLRLVTPDRRFDAVAPAAFVESETLFLCGVGAEWDGVASIELSYTPVAPALTALTDALLLPDAARPCAVAQSAAFMATRVAGMLDVTIDPAAFTARGELAERQYLSSLSLSKRGATLRIREVW